MARQKVRRISLPVSPNTPWVLCFVPLSFRWIGRMACFALVLLLPGTVRMPPVSKSETAPLAQLNPTTIVYSTVLGEHRRIPLPDGSTAELNSDSSIAVTFTSERRWIDLTRGEALFKVAHETDRPFQVRSGRSVIEDIATAFDVYKKPHSTLVSVVDGRIKIYPSIDAASHSGSNDGGARKRRAGSRALAREFHQGQQIELPDNSDAAPRPHATLSAPDLSRLTAWREGRLEFRGESLVQAVEEFGRYHREQFKFADNALRKRRVGGIAYTSSLNEFLVMLRIEFNIQSQISIEPDGTPIITLASGTPKKAR
jgi:ferric-dicitrate binding protein FerR (iron transport regulator)